MVDEDKENIDESRDMAMNLFNLLFGDGTGKEIYNAIFEKATAYGFNVVYGSQIGFPKGQGDFTNVMMADGVHPSLLGHSFHAKSLSGILA